MLAGPGPRTELDIRRVACETKKRERERNPPAMEVMRISQL